MKRLATLIIASLSLNACGADSSGETQAAVQGENNEQTQYTKLYDSMADLPVCNNPKKDTLVYVEKEASFARCTGNNWELIDLRGPKGDKGLAGDDGKDGINGTDGANGKDQKVKGIYEGAFFGDVCKGVFGEDSCSVTNVQVTRFESNLAFVTVTFEERDFTYNNELDTSINKFVKTDPTGNFIVSLGYNYDLNKQLKCFVAEWVEYTSTLNLYTKADCTSTEKIFVKSAFMYEVK